MPRVHCRKCLRTFNDMSNLRKHQWADHREFFKNTGHSLKALKESKELSVRDVMNGSPIVKLASEQGKYKLTVPELLTKLRDQRNFMNDVVSLIEGLVK